MREAAGRVLTKALVATARGLVSCHEGHGVDDIGHRSHYPLDALRLTEANHGINHGEHAGDSLHDCISRGFGGVDAQRQGAVLVCLPVSGALV